MGFTDDMPRVAEPAALSPGELFKPAIDESGDVPTLRLLIDGEWREAAGGETFDVHSPIDGTLLARAQKGDNDDVEEAIEAAVRARAGFRSMSAAERLEICERAGEILDRHLEDMVGAIVVDLGKTPEAGHSEAEATRDRLRLVREEVRRIFGEYIPGDWIGETAGKSAVVLREPVGTVAAVGPFNYPLFLAASKVIPALAAGNTVVAKAPSDDPVPLLLFTRVLEEAGLPPGALNYVTGPGKDIGDLIASHPGISMVSFTGSSGAGRRLAEKAGPKPLHLELGGNAPAIVLADADLELAVAKSAQGAFKNSGQRCDAVSVALVAADVYDDFVARAAEEAASWVAGDPRADGVKLGPLVKASAAERVATLVADAVERGGEVVAGGGQQDAYHQPTVLANVPLDAEIVWEETFGPVLPVVRVADLDEALDVANRSRYGLDSCIFTTNLESAWRAARALEVGQVHVNDAPVHGVGHFPFGGRKPDSGIGREGLGYSIDECTVLKTVVLPTP
ncbi:MAG TPA: aldehyde dehydrogenase family protein [Acidimicrobiales bacterium]|nr:aldehyde dehydrogenase family protein [Acidimicrobiales bacterium]